MSEHVTPSDKSAQSATGGKTVLIIEEAIPDEWADGICPECDRYATWEIQSDLFKPRHGRVSCGFCDAEQFFTIRLSEADSTLGGSEDDD